ncbi:pseudouridine synthase [Methanomicrobiaceae archaeon CYW5]|uniref:archaeosine synthase subunit alpha n=1 Tax=Methanovulcanius yangii TaxID=1789227 RepID=UPI0029CA3E92|nr:archaeosine synthase subunit alpha [Methanovulcanius yangii]MBT8507276.1 pseudouridine synthase [Methanovulcanius yangii]
MYAFEVTARDGFAREGKLTSDAGLMIRTPAVVDPTDLFPSLSSHPLSNIPVTAPDSLAQRYAVDFEDFAIIGPGMKEILPSSGVGVVAGWHILRGNPRQYVELLLEFRKLTPPGIAWYAPAAGLPSNVATMVYSGFDLFDYRAVDLKSIQNIFCTTDGEMPAEEAFASSICQCEGCRTGDLHLHNRLALDTEIAMTGWFFRRGQLRELIEKRCRTEAWQVSVLRHLDTAYDQVEPWLPAVRSSAMMANTGESMNRAEIARFADRLTSRFVPTRTDVAVLLPCSARKPYSQSQSHRSFQKAIQDRAHEVIITSPLGVVPRELELMYPAGHYDVPVTGYWDREEQAFVTKILARYLRHHGYRRVIAHLEGDTLSIAQAAADTVGIDLECTCHGRPTGTESLRDLDESLTGERRMSHNIIQGTLSWQFGRDINTKGMMIKGRMGRRKVLKGKQQLFSIDETTGLFRPTLQGWEVLGDAYTVTIDDFIPQGDVLAPGVTTADPAIRAGDEVQVRGPRAWGAGKAVMGAEEMIQSGRGIAVKTRKVQKS